MNHAESLESSIDRAVEHYSSLFIMPSHRIIIVLTLLTCLIGGFITVPLVTLSLPLGTRISSSLLFALSFFALSTVSDGIIRQVLMRSDEVYDLRRCSSLTMLSNLLWFGFLLLGSLLGLLSDLVFWTYLFSIGFSAVCILRLITLFSTSYLPYWKTAMAALVQPLLCLMPMVYISVSTGYPFDGASLLFFCLSVPMSIATAFVFLRLVDRVGTASTSMPTTAILKAFLANWMEDLNAPVEALFEDLGSEKTIDFSLLAFEAEGSMESLYVTSSFHPGPFRNVGSSMLPFLIQQALEEKLGCAVAVPHGLFGHEFDLSSQKQNQKLLKQILASASFPNFNSKATPFIRTQKKMAHASCQIFGDCAVLILTLAPETTEDFPRELGDFILEKASELGIAHVVILNAHNSIDSPFDMSRAIAPLKEAAHEALKEASRQHPSSFAVGGAKVVPTEFSLEEGMGPGGIHALAVRVGKDTCTYVVIDGNNMISGLREKVLDAIKALGVEDGEVLTTDTHAVNAIVTSSRGYHPLGEAIPHDKLIDHIKQAVTEAMGHLRPAKTAWQGGSVPGVGVIGERQIREMSLLADKAVSRAKKLAVPLFGGAGVFLIALLLL